MLCANSQLKMFMEQKTKNPYSKQTFYLVASTSRSYKLQFIKKNVWHQQWGQYLGFFLK